MIDVVCEQPVSICKRLHRSDCNNQPSTVLINHILELLHVRLQGLLAFEAQLRLDGKAGVISFLVSSIMHVLSYRLHVMIAGLKACVLVVQDSR